MNKKLLIGLIALILIIGTILLWPSKDYNVRINPVNTKDVSFTPTGTQEITPTTKTTTYESGLKSTELYGTIKFVEEDGKWKEITEAKSLLNSGLIVDIQDDGVHHIKVIDYNLTSITIETNFDKSILNTAVPIYDYKRNESILWL